MSEQPLDDRPGDFPRVHDRVVGLKHRYGYIAGLGEGPMSLGASLRKHDLQTGNSLTPMVSDIAYSESPAASSAFSLVPQIWHRVISPSLIV